MEEYSTPLDHASTPNVGASPAQADPLPCPRCGAIDVPRISPGKGPHSHRANCAHCGSFLKWVSRYSAEERIHRQQQFRREAMAKLLPTPTQLSYLIALGYRGAMPENREAASTLIDEYVRQRTQASKGVQHE